MCILTAWIQEISENFRRVSAQLFWLASKNYCHWIQAEILEQSIL